jgi:hypothetical protein
MASELLNRCVGVYAYLRCVLRHCGVRNVRRSPQNLRDLHLAFCWAVPYAHFREIR